MILLAAVTPTVPPVRSLRGEERQPCKPRARGPQGKTCSSSCSSWLHSLRSWSLRQTRRGSSA